MKFGMINGFTAEAFDYVKGKDLSFIEICRNHDPEAEAFIAAVDDIKRNVGGKLDEDVYKLMVRTIEAAHEVGAPVFVCGCNRDAGISLFRNYSFAVEYFSRLLEETDKRNMKLAVYNCSWGNFVHSSAHWDVVLGELPQLMIKYDCSHAYYRNVDYLKELDVWGDRVAHFHVKGAVSINGKRVDDPPAGMDNIDWHCVFALLYKHGYDGGLSIEPHSTTWQGDLGEVGVDFTINYIRPFILR